MTLPLTGERTVPGVASENYWFRRHVAAYRFARRFARGRIVDAGSGDGYGAAMLARRGAVVALELDGAAVAHSAAAYRGVRVVRGDLCRPPLGDRAVDVVVALQVLEHLHCADAFLAGCRAALRDGGILVLSTPNRETFPAGRNPSHVHEYDSRELRRLLEARFRDVLLLGVDHGRLLRALDRALGEPLQYRLARIPYAELPAWIRAVLRTVTSRHLRITEDPSAGLDLLAVCR